MSAALPFIEAAAKLLAEELAAERTLANALENAAMKHEQADTAETPMGQYAIRAHWAAQDRERRLRQAVQRIENLRQDVEQDARERERAA